MVLLRRELGDVLREERQHQGRTLREVSSSASVSLGYISEVERHDLAGGRAEIRRGAVDAVLALLARRLGLTETRQ